MTCLGACRVSHVYNRLTVTVLKREGHEVNHGVSNREILPRHFWLAKFAESLFGSGNPHPEYRSAPILAVFLVLNPPATLTLFQTKNPINVSRELFILSGDSLETLWTLK